jgi:hypothetical protein
MNWHDCEAAWKRQTVPAASPQEVAALEASFGQKRRQMARARFVRHVIEGSMGPLVCIGLGLSWWITGRGGWPMVFAMLLILVGFGVYWLAFTRRPRSEPGLDAPLLTRVDADIADLQRRRRALLTMRSWTFAPVYAAALLVPFVLLVRKHDFAIGFSLYYAAVTLLAWAHNRFEVRRHLDPRLDELEQLRQGLAARA